MWQSQFSSVFNKVRNIKWGLFVLISLIGVSTGIVFQATAENITPANNNTSVVAAPNGVPLVDIARPNAKGLSHNLFREFSVGTQGAILNNSTQEASRSVLGGVVPGNPNLRNGAANVILNEVTGVSRSQLNGYLEVHGHSADVIVANPNGITCNGCGFINTPRATLTTGIPELDGNGNLTGFRVETGDVTFGTLGANFSDIDIVDVLSRKIYINGRIDAKTLRLIAGHNRVNYNDVENPTELSTSTSNEIVIDSSLLGGMYVERLSIVANNKGTGVHMRGDMASSVGDISLRADGSITVGRVSSGRKLTIRSVNKTVSGTRLTSKSALQVTGKEAISFDAISSDATIDVRSEGDSLTIGQASALGNITISGLNDLMLDLVESEQNVTLVSHAGNINITDKSNSGGDTTITAKQNITADKIFSDQSALIEADGDLFINQLQALDDITLNILGAVTGTGSNDLIEAGNNLTIEAASLDVNRLYAGNIFDVTVGGHLQVSELIGINGLIASGQNLTLGEARSNGDISLTASNQLAAERIESTQDVTLNVGALLMDNAATIISNQDLSITISGDYVNNILISAIGTFNLNVDGNLTNNNTIESMLNLIIDVNGRFENNDAIGSGGDLLIKADSIYNNEAVILSVGNMTLQGRGALGTKTSLVQNNSGNIETFGGDLTIYANRLENLGDFVATNERTVYANRIKTGTPPPVPYYPSYACPECYNQLYDGGRTYQFVFIPNIDEINRILEERGETPDQWQDTYWEQYVGTYANYDPDVWSFQVPDESHNYPAGSSLDVITDIDTLVSSNPATIATHNGGNINLIVDDILNDHSFISSSGNLTVEGNTLTNIGSELYNTLSVRSTGNNQGFRSQGWANYWNPPATKIVSRDLVASVPSLIGAAGTIDGNLQNEFTNVGQNVTDITSLDIGQQSTGIINTGIDTTNGNTVINIDNGFFQDAPTDSGFVYETRFSFIDTSKFFGSRYFMDRIGYYSNQSFHSDNGWGFRGNRTDAPSNTPPPYGAIGAYNDGRGYTPDNQVRFLGDSYFEHRLVQNQILQLTGRRYLHRSETDEAEQIKKLIDNAAEFAKNAELQFGVELTKAQIAALTEDIIWYVEKVVNGQRVLVPQVYLSNDTRLRLLPSGAIVSAAAVQLKAGRIENKKATIEAQSLNLESETDIVSSSGVIQGEDVSLKAGQDVVLETETTEIGDGENVVGTVVGLRNQVKASDKLNIEAGRDVVTKGSDISAEGDAKIIAERHVKIQALEANQKHNYEGGAGKKTYTINSWSKRHIGSTVLIDGNLEITARSKIEIESSTVSAGQDLKLDGKDGIDITAKADESYSHFESKKKGFMSKSHRIEETYKKDHKGSLVTSGGDTTLTTEKDINIAASGLHAEKDLKLNGDNVNIDTKINIHDEYKYHKKSGFFAETGKGSFTAGYRKEKHITDTDTATHVLASLSAGQSVVITAVKDIDADAPLIAANDNIELSAGRDVSIKSVQDLFEHHESHKVSQFGVTVSVFENVTSSIKAFTEFDTGKGDGGAKAIATVSSTLRAIDAVSTLAGGHLAGVNVNVGFSSSKSTLDQTYKTAKTGVLQAGEDVKIDAGRDINTEGTTIIAGRDAELKAGRDLNLKAAESTSEEKSSEKSKSLGVGVTVGVTITGGVGISGNVNASASKSKSEGESKTNTNTKIVAGNKAKLESGRDTNLKGARVEAEELAANVGRNLNIESVQNTSKFKSKSKGFSVSTSTDLGGYSSGYNITPDNILNNVLKNGDGKPYFDSQAVGGYGLLGDASKGTNKIGGSSWNLGLNGSKGKGEYAWVEEQSGLIGEGKVDVTVGENTDLKGGIIASKSKDLTLDTGTLTFSDLADKDKSKNVGGSISVGGPLSGGGNESEGKIGGSGDLSVTVEGQYAKKDKEGVTRATVGEGEITIRDTEKQKELEEAGKTQKLANLNRDLDKAQEVTKDEVTEISLYVSDTSVKTAFKAVEVVGKTVTDIVSSVLNELSQLENSAALAELSDSNIPAKELMKQIQACSGGGSQGFNWHDILFTKAYAQSGYCPVTLPSGKVIYLSATETHWCGLILTTSIMKNLAGQTHAGRTIRSAAFITAILENGYKDVTALGELGVHIYNVATLDASSPDYKASQAVLDNITQGVKWAVNNPNTFLSSVGESQKQFFLNKFDEYQEALVRGDFIKAGYIEGEIFYRISEIAGIITLPVSAPRAVIGAVKLAKTAGNAVKNAVTKGRATGLGVGLSKLDCCFVAGTPIKMANGYTNIEKLKVGDAVVSQDVTTGKIALQKVLDVHIRPISKIKTFYKLSLMQGSLHEDIYVTGEHPFWVPEENSWVTVDNLAVGVKLTSHSGKVVQLVGKQRETELQQTYNITVEGYASYFAGKTETLVHNCGDLIGRTTEGYPIYAVAKEGAKPDLFIKAPDGKYYQHIPSRLVVPGRVQSRINLKTGDQTASGKFINGWGHVLDRHFNPNVNASQFTISPSELRALLQSASVIKKPVTRTLNSADHGIRYVREVNVGRTIGTDKLNGYQPTSTMTILSDKFGNLVTATPGKIP